MKQNPFVEKWKKELKMKYEYMSSYQKSADKYLP